VISFRSSRRLQEGSPTSGPALADFAVKFRSQDLASSAASELNGVTSVGFALALSSASGGSPPPVIRTGGGLQAVAEQLFKLQAQNVALQSDTKEDTFWDKLGLSLWVFCVLAATAFLTIACFSGVCIYRCRRRRAQRQDRRQQDTRRKQDKENIDVEVGIDDPDEILLEENLEDVASTSSSLRSATMVLNEEEVPPPPGDDPSLSPPALVLATVVEEEDSAEEAREGSGIPASQVQFRDADEQGEEEKVQHLEEFSSRAGKDGDRCSLTCCGT